MEKQTQVREIMTNTDRSVNAPIWRQSFVRDDADLEETASTWYQSIWSFQTHSKFVQA